MELNFNSIKRIAEEAGIMAQDMGLATRSFTDKELILFIRAIKYMCEQYFPFERIQPMIFNELSLKEFMNLAEWLEKGFAKGNLLIASIIYSHAGDYLLGATVAKESFDKRFTGPMKETGSFYMTILKRKRLRLGKAVSCISGFVSTEKPKEYCVDYSIDGIDKHMDVIWNRDGDVYVCFLPYTHIIKKNTIVDFTKLEETLDLIGVQYTIGDE